MPDRADSLPPPPWVALAIALAAAACTAAPLLVYTVSLAAFGLAHVLAELRYLDARFAPRLTRPLWIWLGVGLVGVASLRVLGVAGVLDSAQRTPLELVLVALLAAGALPTLIRAGLVRAAVGMLLVAGIGCGVAFAPLPTLLLLAALHNLTPVGFLAERLRGRQRLRALGLCAVAFGLIPLVLASGVPGRWLASRDWLLINWAPFGWGPLDGHLSAYLPASWQSQSWSFHLFAAAVFMQVMHYGAVLHVLPRLSDPDRGGSTLLPWPRRRWFLCGVGACASLLFVGFLTHFGGARSVYGVAAAVHAWVELPLLLLALAKPLDMSQLAAEDPVTAGGLP